jgi:DNA-directed RNA polymerase III subunit RPC6
MSTNDDINEKLLELLQSKPDGISNDDIKKNLPSFAAEVLLPAINALIKANRIDILKKGQALLYRLKDVKATEPQKMDNDEAVIYNIIEASGNTGIWVKDIRTKSNLAMQPLTKILNAMEKRKLIKSVKSVNASKKKVYMLYDLEPARSITGGAWYQDSDFETEFVEVLNTQCLRFLNEKRVSAQKLAKDGPQTVAMKSLCTVTEVHTFIKNLQISKVELNEDDLEGKTFKSFLSKKFHKFINFQIF